MQSVFPKKIKFIEKVHRQIDKVHLAWHGNRVADGVKASYKAVCAEIGPALPIVCAKRGKKRGPYLPR